MGYQHIFCEECRGIIGMWDSRKGFICEKCQKEYPLYKLDYDRLLVNDKTGWQFPMKKKD